MRLGDRARREVATDHLLEALPRRAPFRPRLGWRLSLSTPTVEEDGERRVVLSHVEGIRVALASVQNGAQDLRLDWISTPVCDRF
jgi:hypothetical protein